MGASRFGVHKSSFFLLQAVGLDPAFETLDAGDDAGGDGVACAGSGGGAGDLFDDCEDAPERVGGLIRGGASFGCG